MRGQSRTPLCGAIGNNAFKLSHTLCSATLLPLFLHSHPPSFPVFILCVPAYLLFSNTSFPSLPPPLSSFSSHPFLHLASMSLTCLCPSPHPLSAPPHFPQMSTKEKLIGHVMKEEPVGSRNKVTVVGVGMVGMASAISILLKVRQRDR